MKDAEFVFPRVTHNPEVKSAFLLVVPRCGPERFQALVFASSTGSPLAHSNFRRRVWLPALAAVGLEGVHFHDLRHTGNQLTANAGANPRELMARMGTTASVPP